MDEHAAFTVRPLSSSKEGGSSASAKSGHVKDEAIKESEGIDDKEDETARGPRIARRPQTPTKVPALCIRSWDQSSAPELRRRKVRRYFSLDYALMTAEDVGEDMCLVPVGQHHSAAGIWALAVEKKGASETVT